MAGKKLIAICQSGGEFKTNDDGSLLYRGGDAHAMEIDDQLKYNDFKMELPLMSQTCLPVGRVEQPLSEAVVLVDAPPSVVDDVLDDAVDDTTETDEFLDTSFVLLDDTTNVDAGIDIPTVVPALAPVGSNDEKLIIGAQQWQNNITGVGQRFNSVHEFREALRKYAIAHQFAFKYKKNDSHRVTVKCKAEGCPWRIHASRLSTTQLICIKKMNATHTCEGAAVTTGYQATRSWVAGIIKERLKVNSNYKPKDIVNDIKQEYGIQLNYFQAWRGKEIAKEQLQGSYKEAYNQLPFFCEMIMDTNPGSLATFTTKDDSSFHRLFVSFHASLYGFQHGCRPLLFLDSIPLKSKYQGTLLAATAPDGDDGPSRMIHLQNVVTVTPPPTRRPPGRPTTKRFGSQEVVKRQLQCSRCKGAGHNKSTCKQFLLEC
ncbi:MuDR family transposase [Actinidia rufa]|uniref:MuDR family transposase n=1 Tax=Actinidia rufa TaxID=165716 RepID=A0A7J0F6J1_9ERIC|nr:MuDR family transposase [Actinidia rufa]